MLQVVGEQTGGHQLSGRLAAALWCEVPRRAAFRQVSPFSAALPSWQRLSQSLADALFSLFCRDFSWSPGGNIIAFWVPEDKDIPARVTLMQLPTRQEIRVRNLFNVVDCKLHWQKNGDYLCVKVDRTPKGTQVSGCPRAEAPPSSSRPTPSLKVLADYLFEFVGHLQTRCLSKVGSWPVLAGARHLLAEEWVIHSQGCEDGSRHPPVFSRRVKTKGFFS